MNTVDVTVISCIYGDTHDRFVDAWIAGLTHLDPLASGFWIVATDAPRGHPAFYTMPPCEWKHSQAYYLQQALALVDTEWVWIHDIDDIAWSDALQGIDEVAADVWQLGYNRSDGEVYFPPQLTADEVLNSDRNEFVAGSCIRTSKLLEVGGFPDVALQDWALWRRLALAGATFQASDRIHFNYRRHQDARGERELTIDRRDADVREMLDAEGTVAYTG